MIYVHAFSAGEKLTRQCCQRTPRPRYEVPVVEGKPGFPAQAVADWIRDHGIEILNVAGNSEFSAPGIRGITLAYLEELFALAKQ
jgi:hypothetical protein